MKTLESIHQSLIHWQFMPDHDHWLDDTQRMTGATSLASKGAPGSGTFLPVYPLHPLTFNNSFGRMQSAFRCSNYPRTHGFLMRSQAHPLAIDMDNCWTISFSLTQIALGLRRLGVYTKIDFIPYTINANFWYLWRVEWQTRLMPDSSTRFYVTLWDLWAAPWDPPVATFSHSLDYWACSTINRPGLFFDRSQDWKINADNTLIYTKDESAERQLGARI